MAQPPSADCCSICHETFNIPCQANCSHWFCGSCILQVWSYGSALQPCKCPLCRSVITLLIPAESSHLPQDNPEVSRVMREIETYNRMFGERSSGFLQKLRDLPFLLRRLLNDLLDPGRSLPLVIKARVYLAVKFTSHTSGFLKEYWESLVFWTMLLFCLSASCTWLPFIGLFWSLAMAGREKQ